jgi:hypothetical protein
LSMTNAWRFSTAITPRSSTRGSVRSAGVRRRGHGGDVAPPMIH